MGIRDDRRCPPVDSGWLHLLVELNVSEMSQNERSISVESSNVMGGTGDKLCDKDVAQVVCLLEEVFLSTSLDVVNEIKVYPRKTQWKSERCCHMWCPVQM